MHTTLIRDQIGQGLGFSIAGGKGSQSFKDTSEGIYISRITDGGLAHRDGKILVGDKVLVVSKQYFGLNFQFIYCLETFYNNRFELLPKISFFQINGVDMTDATHDMAVQLLTDHQRFVRLVVQREMKGPLEPPLSPHSPSYLKGLSPSGYMANRPGYKRSTIGSTSESPTIESGK